MFRHSALRFSQLRRSSPSLSTAVWIPQRYGIDPFSFGRIVNPEGFYIFKARIDLNAPN
jgi:hypothetical protein